MPKLNFKVRQFSNLEYTTCFLCASPTYEIDQNKCSTCGAYLCFQCAAIDRVYCCDAYTPRFWPGLMKPECEALHNALVTGKLKRAHRLTKKFGDATDAQIMEEMTRHGF